MNPHENPKLGQRQKEQEVGRERQSRSQTQAQAGAQAALEFDSPEAMLRHDAAQVEVPSAVAERLRESIRREPPCPKGWLRRLLGGR